MPSSPLPSNNSLHSSDIIWDIACQNGFWCHSLWDIVSPAFPVILPGLPLLLGGDEVLELCITRDCYRWMRFPTGKKVSIGQRLCDLCLTVVKDICSSQQLIPSWVTMCTLLPTFWKWDLLRLIKLWFGLSSLFFLAFYCFFILFS